MLSVVMLIVVMLNVMARNHAGFLSHPGSLYAYTMICMYALLLKLTASTTDPDKIVLIPLCSKMF